MKDAILLLETLYGKDEWIWIGDRHESGIIGETIRTAAGWIQYFRNGGTTAPTLF